jgi:hypothetical protein
MKHPDARPPRNCIASNIDSDVEYGVSREMTANPSEAPISTRRGP